MQPLAGVGGAVPALQRNRPDVIALLIVEQLVERLDEAFAHLLRGATQEQQAIVSIVENRNRPPPLWLGFGLVEHAARPSMVQERRSSPRLQNSLFLVKGSLVFADRAVSKSRSDTIGKDS